tara:strand:- start:212 stop:523 length:312 start_codon:yes stop_codon:yes gene_type:complete
MFNNIVTPHVYTFKLNSGEEIIAKVIEVLATTGYLTIESPVSVAPGPKGMGLVPSMFTASPTEEVRLNTNSISMFARTDEPVENKYIEATTGIKMPEKKLILG